MTNLVTPKQRGYSLLEFVVAVAIVAVLATVLLNRIAYYQGQAERVSLQTTVANLRLSLQSRVEQGKLPSGSSNLTMLAEENPFNWLKSKPVNYAGEYYAPSDAQIGPGNWCYDRSDKSVVYLLNNAETFSQGQAKRLKFKVKLLHLLNTSGVAENAAGTVVGLDIEQVKT
ncbi:general secretion pathway protein G [Duganella sp. 3397]|uniref:prepilin-type N-terminal cleavage/methylation domain-containing protein n=1 Tax=Duganella sp. 3397 TaxID=2817732 RepID=UPI002861AF26|nr:prepilin-type N-terminal cleavage/methylation domain-containing protein [Duganella sp. 3397]MDR7049279.1 general secretion pathway protein G [Duganella sp. 3397]